MKSRRHFLKSIAASTAAAGFPLPIRAAGTDPTKLRIGIITDVHKDVIHDADARLQTFVDAMQREKVDAIIQLGDFCIPKPANRAFLAIFNQFSGPRYHVLGNHDMDGGFTRDQAVAFLGMKSRYYSFDLGGFHFVVLDANDKPKDWNGGYPHFIAEDQFVWLSADLSKTSLNTFVLSHQSLERSACIDNQAEVRAILEAAITADGKPKVAGCFNGHWHIDHHRRINNIPYLHINSASYFWLGEKYKHECLDPALATQYPWVSSTAPYQKPLFTILEIDPGSQRFSITGAKTDWLGPSPQSLGYPTTPGEEHIVTPSISAVTETYQPADLKLNR